MDTIRLKVIRKNRKYFKCETDKGYGCRLIIDNNSKDLTIGEHTLAVNDKSIRSKYGTDLIFELAADHKEIETAGIVSFYHPNYNVELVEKCRELGGRWDKEENVWIFASIIEDKVEELDEIYNSDPIGVEISRRYDQDKNAMPIGGYQEPVYFLGYVLATAHGRDSGAKLGQGVSLIEGVINSGGSMKNWRTDVSENAVFRLFVPEKLLEQYLADESNILPWIVKKI